MRKRTLFIVLLALLFCPLSVSAQVLTTEDLEGSTVNPNLYRPNPSASSSPKPGQLSSPSVSRKFYEIAYELASSKDVKGPEVEQAIAFLTAAMELDSDARGVRPLLIEFACRKPELDYSNLVYGLLIDYVDEFADLEVARKAVGYLLECVNSREEREKLLEQALVDIGSKNTVLGSELATMLGLLKVEKADMNAAQFYLTQAYKNNRYNKAAFAKLTELTPEEIEPVIYLERLRLALRENPSDIETAISFAQKAEQLELYKTAADAYEYCADLFDYLYPSEALSARIYLPWVISSYNTQKNQSKCLQIAERVQKESGFDLRLESIVGKAAIKIGDGELATQILQAAEEKIQQLIQQAPQRGTSDSGTSGEPNSKQVYTEQLAWFYCFALPVPSKALHWANTAYNTEPNSPVTAAILAYALVMNKQIEWAKPIVNNYERNQIAELALAQIQIAEGQTDSAIETLKSAIARDPGSFAAEQAKEILAQQGKEYVPPVDSDRALDSLGKSFGQTLVPVFTPPERIISAQLNIEGKTFPYGSEFNGIVAIKNNSPEPLIISDNGLFKGNIRVDADISGDLDKKVPNLVLTKIQTSFPVEPGRSILIPLRLNTGELRNTLITYPQASLDIEFTLFLDPVITDGSKVANRLTQIEPTKVSIKRPGIELTGKYLRDQFNSIMKNQIDQKIKTAQLFAGLLSEQYAMSNREPPYRFMYADWMAPLIRNALLHESGLLRNPNDDEWLVKVHTMAELLSLPLDHELISAVAENLSNSKWPVRMMAIYLLNKSLDGNFNQVLDWTVRNDTNKTVRDMAIILSRASSE